MAKRKRTNKDLQNIKQKTKDRGTQAPLNTRSDSTFIFKFEKYSMVKIRIEHKNLQKFSIQKASFIRNSFQGSIIILKFFSLCFVLNTIHKEKKLHM